jgi:hypothetical protein
METIKLSEKVVVSDPSYPIGTWCQAVIDNVLDGDYIVEVEKRHMGEWGTRCATLMVLHSDFKNEKKIKWETTTHFIGVDSGQAGVFNYDSYKNDSVFKTKSNFYIDAPFLSNAEEGDEWYGHMCDRTLSEQRYGTYENGVVSSSGFGDGSYKLFITKSKGKVVGFYIDFLME